MAVLPIEELLMVRGGVVVAEEGERFVMDGEALVVLPSQRSVSAFMTTRIDELVERAGEASRW